MARIIYEQEYYIVLHCEECGIMQGHNHADYFEGGGHLAAFDDIRPPAEARRAQRVPQRWHDDMAS